jgi:hypothetical protein
MPDAGPSQESAGICRKANAALQQNIKQLKHFLDNSAAPMFPAR